MELQSFEELDLPPEYCCYQDEGCEFSESCLSCPLPMCVLEEPGGRRKLLKQRRTTEMGRLSREGWSTRELAKRFGVSQRTVQRVLRGADEYTRTQEARDG